MLDLRSSVYARVVLFLAVVCLALLGLDMKQIWTARDTRLQEARTDTDNLARSLAQHAQDVFETTDAVVNGLSDTILAEGRDPAAVRRLERRMRLRVADQKILNGLFVFDENGNWVGSSQGAAAPDKVRDLNYAGRDFFRYHRDHGDDAILVSPPVRNKADGVWAITVTRRVNQPDGSFGGVVDASVSIEHFQRFFETFDIGKQGVVSLTSGQGIVIIRRPFDEGNTGRNIAQGEFFRKIQRDADAGGFEYTSLIDGKSRLASFRRVPGFDLLVSVALDKNEVLAPWWHETKVHLVWSAITILFMLILGYRLTIQIRDRVAAEAVARTLRIEADQIRKSDAERNTYERELEQQKRELERSNAALEQFAYAASHDLQAPLRAIAHLAQWIDEDVRATASPDTIDNLTLLNGRVARLQMLTSGLLAYARVGRADFVVEDVDVAAAVQDVVSMLSPRPNFVVACDGEMPTIRTHRTPLQLVLRNLISNALQHHDRDSGRVDVAMEIVGDMAEIRIGDDGAGIEPRFHDEIFVIFKTLRSRDEVETGGMGLAMVKKLVTENGGRIRVESNPPARGATFVFTWKVIAPG
jgi:signal transduction histidine kinase